MYIYIIFRSSSNLPITEIRLGNKPSVRPIQSKITKNNPVTQSPSKNAVLATKFKNM